MKSKELSPKTKRYIQIFGSLYSATIFMINNPKDESVVEYKKYFCSFVRFLTGVNIGEEYIKKMTGYTSLGKADLSFMFVALEEIIKKVKENEDQE